MGQYFKIVNPAKKQYIDASRFNENVKSSGVLYGYHATAIAFLVCNIDQVRDGWGRPIYNVEPLAGSWCGDPVFIVSDDHGKPDEFNIKTSTEKNSDRNLSWMAKEEFEDISYKAIALICNMHEEYAEEMAKRAGETSRYSDSGLVELGNVIFYIGCDPLERALVKEFGADWGNRYKRAWPESHASS